VVGESGRGDARVEVWVSAAARAGNHSPVGAGGVDLASWHRGSGGKADNRSGVAGMASVRRVYIYMSAAADPFLAGAGGLVKG
jgi:hypothetical protein